MTAIVWDQGGGRRGGLGPGRGQSLLRGVYNPAPAPNLTPHLLWQGFLVSVLYCFINKEVGRAPARRPRPLPPAPSAGRAGNGAPRAASERCSVAGAVGDPAGLAPLPPAPQTRRRAVPTPRARLPDPALGFRPRPGRRRPRSVLEDTPRSWG